MANLKIVVTPVAAAAVAGQIKPKFVQGLSFQWSATQTIGLPAGDFLTDAGAAQLADLLGGAPNGVSVVKLQPRVLWLNGVPNSSQLQNLPLQNFIAFADHPGAPNPADLLVVNAADIATQACVGFTFGLPVLLAKEQAIAYVVPGSSMSDAATAALDSSPIANWPPTPTYWLTPDA